MSTLKSTLNNAVRDEVIAVNPMNGIKTIKNTSAKATETIHRALTQDEQKTFFEAARNNYYYEFMALMVQTGMRQGEVAALTIADIDFKKNVIHVARTMTLNSKGNIITGNTPKTDKGKRDIPLNENIKGLINAQLEKRQAIFNSKSVIPIDTPIFTTSRGGRVFDYLVNKAISKVLAELEADGKHIEPFTSHAFRDTFATRFVEQTKDLHTLQKILGHASFAMTADLYAHVLDETKQDAMQKIQIII
jgi:integrase